jgi:hypothetical protein
VILFLKRKKMKRFLIVLIAALTLFAGCFLFPQEEEEFEPPAKELTVNVWANDDITLNSQNWFKFTATANIQYIHINCVTLPELYMQVYNKEGKPLANRERCYGIIQYKPFTVTSGQEYYIEVTPASYSSTLTGTYRIAFSNFTTPPLP